MKINALLAILFLGVVPSLAQVTTARDELDPNASDGTGISLREAIRDAQSGDNITFAFALSSETLILTMGQLSIDKNLTIDASHLANGFTIDAGGQSRVMVVQPGRSLTLEGLTLTGGRATGPYPNGRGGAIYVDGRFGGNSGINRATLTLNSCTLLKNSAEQGGAIFSDAENGGESRVTINHSTFVSNQSDNFGGAIYHNSDRGRANLTLNDCTIVENSASGGGGIYRNGSSALPNSITLRNTILADNSADNSGPDLLVTGAGTVTPVDKNLLSSLEGHLLSEPNITLVTDLKLAPLGYYGGPTMTMHPLAGSPAVPDESNIITRLDQRGFSVNGPATIGSVQLRTPTIVSNEDELRTATSSIIQPGAVIRFSSDLNDQTITLASQSSPLSIPFATQGLFIDASNLTKGVTIDANASPNDFRRVLTINENATVALHNLTFTGGHSSGSGGAIILIGRNEERFGRLTLIDSIITNNFATFNGGGIYNTGTNGGEAKLYIYNSVISHNTSSEGGGIHNDAANGQASLSLIDSIISENSTPRDGGGIFNNGSNDGSANIIISGSTFLDNSAGSGGGGVYNDGSGNGSILGQATLSIYNATFAENTSSLGGAIHNDGTSNGDAVLHLNQATLSRNSASSGGAIYTNGTGSGNARISFLNSTLSANQASLSGGGLFSLAGSNFNGDVFLSFENSILAGNTAPEAPNRRELGNVTTTETGNNIFSGDPKLAPLGYFGGPTMTMHPLADSPAILSGDDTIRIDQRGFRLTGPATIGAVKLGPITVGTTSSDQFSIKNESVSLRSAIADAFSIPGAIIRFNSALNGDTITLQGTQLEIPSSAKGLFIEASNLPSGLTINANQQSRVLFVHLNATAALHGLTLTGGNTFGSFGENHGGAIFIDGNGPNNSVSLSLSACTISHNTALLFGGGIFSNGKTGSAILSLNSCTVSGNVASFGGGIYSDASSEGSAELSLTSCTFSDNSAQSDGGGIFCDSFASGRVALKLLSCTLSGNSALQVGGGLVACSSLQGDTSLSLRSCTISNNSATGRGGGIFHKTSLSGNVVLNLSNTIVADNIAPDGPDLSGIGDDFIANAIGVNLVTTLNDGQVINNEGTIITDAPTLAPLANYGGPTMTMLPLPDSPAIDAGSNTRHANLDQRGFFVTDGSIDIGATEAPNWFEPTAAELAGIFNTDLDGDGNSYGMEILLGTAPFTPDPGHPNNLAPQTDGKSVTFGRDQNFTFPYLIELYRSFTLEPDSFSRIYSYDTSSHTQASNAGHLDPDLSHPDLITLTDSSSAPKAFYQLRFESNANSRLSN